MLLRRRMLIRALQLPLRLLGRQKRVVFLHIPKCAGSSLNYHFKWNYGSKRSGRSVYLDSINGTAFDPSMLEKARSALFVGGHFGWNTLEKVRDGAFTFTVLRHPFERLRSFYLYCRDVPHVENVAIFPHRQARVMPFAEFCLSDDPAIRMFVDNAQARTLAHDYLLESGETFDLEAVAGQAIEHLQSFDFVTTTERLEEAMPRLAALTGTRLLSPGMQRNIARSRLEPPDSGLVEALRDRLWADFAVYNEAGRLAGLDGDINSKTVDAGR